MKIINKLISSFYRQRSKIFWQINSLFWALIPEFGKIHFLFVFSLSFSWLRWESICLQSGRLRFNPWVGKIPWRRKWQSTLVLLPGKSHGGRSLVDYSPWGCKESDMTGWLSLSLSSSHFFLHWCGYRVGRELNLPELWFCQVNFKTERKGNGVKI